MEPILFVHGFGGNKKQYVPIIKNLKERGFSQFYEFEYQSTVGIHPIKKVAEELAKYIEENVREQEINIIAISQGGIIALTYMKFFNNKNVKRLFTLCSPHKGSLLANVLNLPGLIDLRPGSDLLREIGEFVRNEKINIYCVYTPFDLMVFPGWNARSDYGKKKIIFAPAHPAAFYWPSTIKFILKNLENGE